MDSQKNVVQGNITNAGSVKTGDETHHHYQTEKRIIPKELTASIPKTRRDQIIGREAELSDLHYRLFNNRQVVLVNGLGGIGKTTLAQVYTAHYWDEYRHVAWISQTSDGITKNDITNDFISTKGLLESLLISGEGKDPNALLVAILTELKRIEDGPNLLLIDNADSSLSALYDSLPSQPRWHILATSREQIKKFDVKELGFLSEPDAIALFLSHYTLGKMTNDEIKALVIAVDLHTLTIEILAKTAQLQRTEMKELKNAIEADLKANVYVDHKGGTIGKITSYLCSIFTVSRLSENDIWLLRQCICLPAEFHRYELLKDLINPAATQREEIFSEILERLSNTGWLLKNRETDSYKMHRIIADVIKKQRPITLADVAPVIARITKIVSIDQTKDNPVDKFPWIPFGASALTVFPNSSEPDISVLQNNLALVLNVLGDYAGAKNLLEKAVRSDEKNLGAEHPTTAVSYSNLALVLQDLGDYTGAKNLLEKAMRSDEKNLGAEHPTTAVSYSNLASVLQDLGDYTGAKTLLEKAVRSIEKNFGAEHLSTARSYSNLAVVLQDLGDYAGAKNLLEKAVRSDEKNFGAEHPITAVRYSNLATVLRNLGDYAGAKTLLEKAMRSAEKNLGAEHPTTALRYSNLAFVLKDLGDYEGALVLSGKALRVFQGALPTGHPYIKQGSDNYQFIQQQISARRG